MIGWTAVGSFCLVFVVGLSPESTTYTVLIATLLATISHANLKTPWLLGFLIQRPESHSIHHQRDVHAYNYSGLPLIDMLFGTFKNPREFAKDTSFYIGASNRMLEMLLFKNIEKPKK